MPQSSVIVRPAARSGPESRARPLIAAVRAAVLAADGPDCAAAVLATAPPEACQALADLWSRRGDAARAAWRASLSAEERLVLDIVVHTYPPTQPPSGSFDFAALVDDALAEGGP